MSLAVFKRSAEASKQSTKTLSCDCGDNVPAAFARAARPRKPLIARVDWRGAVLPIAAIAIWWAISEAHVVKSGLLGVWLEKPSGGSWLVRCCFPGWLLGESSVLGSGEGRCTATLPRWCAPSCRPSSPTVPPPWQRRRRNNKEPGDDDG